MFCRFRWLTLADNKLSWLPLCFRNLDKLRHLNLSGNRFSAMPPAVGFLRRLRYCLFSRNYIRFPDYIVILRLSAIGNIKKMSLDQNPLIGSQSLRRVCKFKIPNAKWWNIYTSKIFKQFPFLHVHNTWLDWAEEGSTWQDSLDTSSLDDSFSSMSSFEPHPPVEVTPEVVHKAVAYLL